MFLDHTLIVIMFLHLMYSLMMRSIINLSGAGSDAKEQVEAGDPYSSVETPIEDFESVRNSEERVSLPIKTNDHYQRTTLGYVPIHHQRDNATLQSTTIVDVPVEVLPEPQGHHMITRQKEKEHHLSIVARSRTKIVGEPNTTKEGLKSTHWLASMHEDIDCSHTNKISILVPESPDINLVG